MTSETAESPKDKESQPRRRISRACDGCRIRKTKCNGKLPCKGCIRFERDCTYDRSGLRSRGSQGVYLIQLEAENRRLKALLDIKSPTLPPRSTISTDLIECDRRESISNYHQSETEESEAEEDLVQTMIEAPNQYPVATLGEHGYLGHYAGLTLLERIRELCDRLVPRSEQTRNPPLPFISFDGLYANFSRPLSDDSLAFSNNTALPPKAVAQYLVSVALENACSVTYFVHRPSFDRCLDSVYSKDERFYTEEDLQFIPTLYAALALGKVNVSEGCCSVHPSTCDCQRYFRAAQSRIDTTNCRDIWSLQTQIFLIMYLQTLGRLSACYSFLSLASATAIGLGVHRATAPSSFDFHENEIRKRAFWALRTIDSYVTTMMGLPRTIRDCCVDADLPLELADRIDLMDQREVSDTGPSTKVTKMTAVNLHTKLIIILSKIMDQVYLVGECDRIVDDHCCVKYSSIVNIEQELEQWHAALPVELQMDDVETSAQLRIQLRLRLAYAHVQMVLYRPFLHHIMKKRPLREGDLRGYGCASACVKAAMQMIWLIKELQTRGWISGPSWPKVYYTFFASNALILFILSNVDDPTTSEALKAVDTAWVILAELGETIPTARACAESLQTLMNRYTLTLWSQVKGQTYPSANHDGFVPHPRPG